jgi:hypothetical protein
MRNGEKRETESAKQKKEILDEILEGETDSLFSTNLSNVGK